MIPVPAIYTGTLRHRRFRPIKHEFAVPLFMAFLDIDRIPELVTASPFLSHNRFNWASFDDRDHCGDPSLPLRQRLRIEAERDSVQLPEGPVFLLTHLRYFGFNFNPVSFFYFYGSTGELEVILSEVHNTFGEVHNYWLTPEARVGNASALHYAFPKAFHVSPFLSMDCRYDFTFVEPGPEIIVQTNESEAGAAVFDSTLRLTRKPWCARSLHAALLRHPVMTAGVVASIHWQALQLYWKGVPVAPHPGRGRFRSVHPKHSRINRRA